MRLITIITTLIFVFALNANTHACDGLQPVVTNNTYLGNGEYLLTIDLCAFVSNGTGSEATGVMININGANVISVETPSLTSSSTGVTIFPNINSSTQVEYGDWGNDLSPIFQNDGDPIECWTIEIIVDNGAASVDISFSTSNDASAPGSGMVSCGSVWCCTETLAVPPAVCSAAWNPPTLCPGAGSIDLDNTTSGTGVFSGTGVNSANGVFNPSGLSGAVSVTFTVGDAFFNCSSTQGILIEDLTPPILNDTTICDGDFANLNASVETYVLGPCTYSISMWDTYGDGWQGGNATVYVDGVAVLTGVTLSSGYGPATNDFEVMPGQTITVSYSSGSWSSENYYTIFDGAGGSGSSLYSSNPGSTPPSSQAVSNPCAGVMQPTPASYAWSPSAGLSDPNAPDPTATISSTTTYSVQITSSSGCVQNESVTVTVDNCLLPIELSRFEGVCDENVFILEWETLSEFNSDYFEILHSANGEDFEKVGEVSAAGYSISKIIYDFRVKNEWYEPGLFVLKEVDIDGSITTSEAISITCDNSRVSAVFMGDDLHVKSNYTINNVRIMDASGRLLYEGDKTIIQLNDLERAIYFVVVDHNQGSELIKVFK